jgi:hypothetical protein
LEAGILYPHKIEDVIPIPMHEYILKQHAQQVAVLEAAYKHQDLTDDRHLEHTPAEPETEFDIDSYVLVQYENDDRTPPSKVHPILRGPYQIIGIHRRQPKGTIYSCRNLATQKVEDFHIKLLVPYYHDQANADPRDAAMADNQNFEVECILDHLFEGKKQLRSTLKFKVKWVGYPIPSWEPYNTMSKVRKVHEYLTEQRLTSFIPNTFKSPTNSNKRQRLEMPQKVELEPEEPSRRSGRKRKSFSRHSTDI